MGHITNEFNRDNKITFQNIKITKYRLELCSWKSKEIIQRNRKVGQDIQE